MYLWPHYQDCGAIFLYNRKNLWFDFIIKTEANKSYLIGKKRALKFYGKNTFQVAKCNIFQRDVWWTALDLFSAGIIGWPIRSIMLCYQDSWKDNNSANIIKFIFWFGHYSFKEDYSWLLFFFTSLLKSKPLEK